jgi:hypothetical protein
MRLLREKRAKEAGKGTRTYIFIRTLHAHIYLYEHKHTHRNTHIDTHKI